MSFAKESSEPLNNEAEQVSFLMHALNEAQASVRSFDTKAQIVGVGYIFAMRIVSEMSAWNPENIEFSFLAILISWLLVMVPIIFFGAVLYPSRKLAPKLGEKSSHVLRLYHVSNEHIKNVDSYLGCMEKVDIKAEISYELLKTSALRELKRVRFLHALYASCISFMVIFCLQSMVSSGLLN